MQLMVAFDGSNVSKEAVALAVRHAKIFSARIEIVWSLFKGTESDREAIDTAEKALTYRKSVVEDAGVPCETHLLIRGKEAGPDLVDFAGEHGIEMLYIGVRRRSKVGKLFFGSTSQFVILNAQCPVVTVK